MGQNKTGVPKGLIFSPLFF